jgi:hypothetical protein
MNRHRLINPGAVIAAAAALGISVGGCAMKAVDKRGPYADGGEDAAAFREGATAPAPEPAGNPLVPWAGKAGQADKEGKDAAAAKGPGKGRTVADPRAPKGPLQARNAPNEDEDLAIRPMEGEDPREFVERYMAAGKLAQARDDLKTDLKAITDRHQKTREEIEVLERDLARVAGRDYFPQRDPVRLPAGRGGTGDAPASDPKRPVSPEGFGFGQDGSGDAPLDDVSPGAAVERRLRKQVADLTGERADRIKSLQELLRQRDRLQEELKLAREQEELRRNPDPYGPKRGTAGSASPSKPRGYFP